MSSIINQGFHIALAESTFRDIKSNTVKFYYFIGKALPYGISDEPETPNATFHYEQQTKRDIVLVKRVSINDISFVIPRIDWSNGTVYDHYDDSYSATNLANSGASSLETAKFYIVTSSNNVYKCLDNNNNAPSLIQPSNTDNLPFKESDGYVWKFMYSIPLILQRKFTTPAFIPVTTSMSSRYYNNGEIDNVVILNGGSGYHPDSTTITIVSSTGKDAVIRPDIDNITGAITGIIIDNPGESYLDVEYQVLDADELDPGSGAVLTSATDFGTVTTQQSNVELSATNGSIEYIKVELKGIDYNLATTQILVTGDGQGCTAIPVLNSSNQIESITITNSGYDYTFANITITDSVGHGASARAIISPFGGHGKNAIKELFGNRILFSTSIHKDNINGFVIDNDYRQFGIVKDPIGSDSLPYYGIIGTPCYSISTTGSFSLLNYPNDTILNLTTGDYVGKEFIVIAAKSNTNGGSILVQPKDNTPLAITNSLAVKTDPSIIFRIDSLTIPSINPFSGDILYIDNRHSFYQSNEQTISLQTTIKF
jgi:hypothetical protein